MLPNRNTGLDTSFLGRSFTEMLDDLGQLNASTRLDPYGSYVALRDLYPLQAPRPRTTTSTSTFIKEIKEKIRIAKRSAVRYLNVDAVDPSKKNAEKLTCPICYYIVEDLTMC